MTTLSKFAVVTAVAFILPTVGLCFNGTSKENFESELFAPATISSFDIDPLVVSNLTKVELEQVLGARKVLVEFFLAFEDITKDPTVYLSGGLRMKYNNRDSMSGKLVPMETSVILIGIDQLNVIEPKVRVEFKFYILLYQEGNIVSDTNTALLIYSDFGWKIDSVAGLK